jgi:hypothetical protein
VGLSAPAADILNESIYKDDELFKMTAHTDSVRRFTISGFAFSTKLEMNVEVGWDEGSKSKHDLRHVGQFFFV